MSKYSSVLKLKVVEEYLSEYRSYGYLKKKYDIPSQSIIEEWIRLYQQYGEEGLEKRLTKTTYSGEFKLRVIKYRQINRLSYRETANHFKISNPSVIANWVRKYNDEGFDGLSRFIGRSSKMPEKEKKISPKKLNESEREELIRLREENEYLRAKHEYEKKLKALVQKRELQTRRKQK